MDKSKGYLTFILLFIMSFLMATHSICLSQATGDEFLESLRESSKLTNAERILEDFFEGKTTTRIIVGIREPANAQNMQEQLRNRHARREMRQAVQAAQQEIINTLDPDQVRVTETYNFIYGFAAEVTPEGLRSLIDTPDITFIEKDEKMYAHLAQGIPLMNASVTRSNYSGWCLSIAICDSGIDYNHPRLGNGGFPNTKVIGGYDFGDDDADPLDPQGHGTACAGIAAGDLGTAGNYIGGVAYGAKLYALKITTGDTGTAYFSDMAGAWDWCVLHQYDHYYNPIMIISTSFGSGRYYGSCDHASTVLSQAADNAMAAGMTLFVSSGNDGYCDSIGIPACLDSVISVGAVYDADIGRNPPAGYIGCIKYGSCAGVDDPSSPCPEKSYIDTTTYADQVCTYSNTSEFLDLLAPAAWGTTTERGGGYWDTPNGFGGTSAACPYAAGAAACLQHAAKAYRGTFLSHHELKTALVNTGVPVTDGKVFVTTPRVNLGSAVASVTGVPFPEAPTLRVDIFNAAVSISWNSVAHASGYLLSYAPYPYTGPDTIRSVDMGPQTGLAVTLPSGAAFYLAVQAYNRTGFSPYSNISYFWIN